MAKRGDSGVYIATEEKVMFGTWASGLRTHQSSTLNTSE